MNFSISHKTHYDKYSTFSSRPLMVYNHTVTSFKFESGVEFSKSTNMPEWLYNEEYYELEELIAALPEPEALEVLFHLDLLSNVFKE